VLVTYTRQAGQPFFDVIKDVVLDDGRNAADVICVKGGHETHFHWYVAPAPGGRCR
jgi:hypothetical protein